jgi:hypothetical protein
MAIVWIIDLHCSIGRFIGQAIANPGFPYNDRIISKFLSYKSHVSPGEHMVLEHLISLHTSQIHTAITLYPAIRTPLENKNNNAPSKFLIIWLTDKQLFQSDIQNDENRHKTSSTKVHRPRD